MATGPPLAKTPLELLSGPAPEPPLLSKYFAPVIWGTVGFVSVLLANFGTKKPLFAGIQRHIGVAAVASGVGTVIDGYRNKYLADRDAILRHYVELHPEDFPPFERVKFKDVFEPWIPIR